MTSRTWFSSNKLTNSSALEPKLVSLATTTQTDTLLSNPAIRSLPQSPRLNQLHRLQLQGLRIRMRLTAVTRTIFKCGMQQWRHNNNNKAAKVKVSNDKAQAW